MRRPFDKKSNLILLCGILFLSLMILSLSAQAKKKKMSERGWLGVYIQELDEDLVEAMDLKTDQGVLVNDVVNNSPAEEAGIKARDVIVKYDGKKVKKPDDLTESVRETRPGQKVTVEVNRDGSNKKLTVVIGEAPESHEYFYNKDWDLYPGSRIFSWSCSRGYLGVSLQSLSEQLGDYFGVKGGRGALITEVEDDSPGEKAGLKAGDVIVKIDDEEIEDPGDVIDVIHRAEKGDEVNIEVIRERKRQTFTARIEERESLYGYRELLKRAKIHLPGAPLLEPDMLRIEIDKDKLEREMEKLKEELKELKEELKTLKEKGI